MRVPPDRITVVGRGRDPDRLGTPSPGRTAAARIALGLSAAHQVVVAVGRQEYQKGHRHLVDAFGLMAGSHPDAVLVIAGRQGKATADLEAQIERLGLGGRVRLLGHRGDVAEVLAAADVFAFPSLYEGLGGALIEAMALGVPIVASDLAALREVVRSGENADLVPPADPAALAQALSALLDDEPRRQAYGARSRQLFEQSFDGAAASEALLALLAKIAR
ncbi:MAG: glycosyltransferase [Acidimicrobiia bacterium]|nr:glycosyltransferase [Acidimicrobiia bacterium]